MVLIVPLLKHALILGLCACLACTEVSTTTYKSIADARADGLFKRGWMPDVLPDDAGPLTEAHDLDTNVRCARSRIGGSVHPDLVARLHRLGFEDIEGSALGSPAGFCPFGRSDVNTAAYGLRRRNARIGDQEFAAVTRDGEFFFWSAY
jgi:hypothetical protein